MSLSNDISLSLFVYQWKFYLQIRWSRSVNKDKHADTYQITFRKLLHRDNPNSFALTELSRKENKHPQ